MNTTEKLKVILDEHYLWLTTNATEGRAADLRSADLRSADLRGADLTSAILTDADLRSADLRSADLRGADLSGADLRRADLTGADLTGADLTGADLRSADLRGADLTGADLTSAGLTGADGTYSMFYGGKHSAWATCSHIGIGCKMLTHAEWRKQYATIGVRYGYTPAEIERYHAWIISLDWLIEMAPAV